ITLVYFLGIYEKNDLLLIICILFIISLDLYQNVIPQRENGCQYQILYAILRYIKLTGGKIV
ncbi:MAG: hypothetical protein K2I96_17520, partial [Lachnospiraceae bacterium]|nr:hypothetical protein [Lachnospiraceae bacterium]